MGNIRDSLLLKGLPKLYLINFKHYLNMKMDCSKMDKANSLFESESALTVKKLKDSALMAYDTISKTESLSVWGF